ncbi:MAG TPA: OsmC family protein [Fimbriimonas sp.]|nr:OsmC family protein [Fimbriimonas sp.]
MVRTATAVWNGSLKEGTGTVSTESTAISNVPYSFRTRFADGVGLNPEELIGAAHAGCFSMALSGQLGERGITADSVQTEAAVTMENLTVTKSALTTTVKAPGADRAKIQEAADAAKSGCPISKLLNAEITLDLTIS